VGYDAALVVREAVLPRLVHLEVVVPPDGELSVFGDLPVERPEAVALTELADCLWIRYDCAGRCRRSLECRHRILTGRIAPHSVGGEQLLATIA